MKKIHILLTILLTFFVIAIEGYAFIAHDTAVYIPLLKYYTDSSLYPNDPFITSLKNTTTPFYFLIGKLSKIIDMQWIFLVTHFLVKFFLLISIFLLSFLLFKNIAVSYLSVVLTVLTRWIDFGGTEISASITTPWYIAIPFLIFAIYFFLKNKYSISFLLLALAAYFHLIAAFFVFVMFSFYFLVSKKITKKIILSFVIFFLLISPLIFKSLKILQKTDPTFLANEWLNLVRLIVGSHIFPSSWPLYTFAIFGAFVLFFIISLEFKPEDINMHNKMVIFSFVIFILCIVAVIFAEVFPLPFIITLSLFRSTTFFKVIASAYISNYLYISLKNKKVYSAKIKFNKRLFFVSAILIFYIGIIIGPMFVGEEIGVFQKIELPSHYKPSVFEDVSLWIKYNTSKNSLFITHPISNGFRAYSERSNLVDSKTTGVGVHDFSFASITWQRMKDVCNSPLNFTTYKEFVDACNKGFSSLTESEFKRIARKYNATHIIIEKPKSLNFTLLYENEEFRLYKI